MQVWHPQKPSSRVVLRGEREFDPFDGRKQMAGATPLYSTPIPVSQM